MQNLATPEGTGNFLAEIAPQIDGLAVLLQNDKTAWTVGFDDETAFVLEWVGGPDRLVMTAELGTPPARRRTEVLQTLLSYTTLWRDHGGVKVGQGGEDGELVLLYEWHAALFDRADLPGVLANFGDIARLWRGYVGSEVSDSPPPPGMRTLTMRV